MFARVLAGEGAVEVQDQRLVLRLMALTAMAYMWNRIVVASHKGLEAANDNAFYEAKIATARFFMARVLPQTVSLNHQIKAGASTLMALPAEAF